MTRDEIRTDILSSTSNCVLAELPTSVGKSRVALDFMHDRNVTGKILIVIPRKVLKNTWKKEFEKWGYESYFNQVTFTTYISLPKHTEEEFNLVIFDECHHLSARARDAVCDLKSDYYVLLSATITKALRIEIQALFPNIECFKISMKQAIEDEILPDPKVYLMPLKLDEKTNSEEIWINYRKGRTPKVISFYDRFNARKDKNHTYLIRCTPYQYYQDISGLVNFYKKSYLNTNNCFTFNKWQRAAKDRLLWLSNQKNAKVLELLKQLENNRTLTFCNGVEQTKVLGKYCINSKEEKASDYLDKFNEGKINHITACDMLNEGVNLVNCQVGIFAMINGSETMILQKNGRILRHEDPIIYILYYKDTREEELVNEIITNYNQDLITVIEK